MAPPAPPPGIITVTVSPDAHLQLIGEHAAENDAVHSRLQIGELALAHGLANRRYARLERRIDTAHDGAAHRRGVAQHRVGIEKGRGTDEPGGPLELLHARRASRRCAPPCALKVACAERLRRRLRSSVSKPFMTEITVINARTPRATPSSDTQVMKETKKLCSRASEYRRPTKTGRG